MKVLLDMNLSPSWVAFLVDNGFDAVHWSQLGDPRAKDIEIMDWARTHDFVVFTHDLDFSALLASTLKTGPSVLQVRTQDVMPGAIGDDVVRILRDYEDLIRTGVLITIDEVGSR